MSMDDMDVGASPGPRVLVVDDHAESREGCATMLAQAGFHVVTAINGLDGLVKALAVRPDVILMDLAMPDLDGLACTRQLASSSTTRDIPVVMLTAHSTPEARAKAADAGARAFLVKPYDPPLLVAELCRLAGVSPAAAPPSL